MADDLRASATASDPTSGKQLPDTPEWMSGLRLNYTSGTWYGNVDAKYTGASFSTLVNDESINARTIVNAAVGYRFESAGFFKKPSIQFNVTNLFDADYVQINSGSGSNFTPRAVTNSAGAGQAPAYYIGAPRFASVTFRSEF